MPQPATAQISPTFPTLSYVYFLSISNSPMLLCRAHLCGYDARLHSWCPPKPWLPNISQASYLSKGGRATRHIKERAIFCHHLGPLHLLLIPCFFCFSTAFPYDSRHCSHSPLSGPFQSWLWVGPGRFVFSPSTLWSISSKHMQSSPWREF